MKETIETYAFLAVVILVIAITARVWHAMGYDQGRNDGFKSGWREAMESKEIPEPPTEDERDEQSKG